jgi:hypothetical protein
MASLEDDPPPEGFPFVEGAATALAASETSNDVEEPGESVLIERIRPGINAALRLERQTPFGPRPRSGRKSGGRKSGRVTPAASRRPRRSLGWERSFSESGKSGKAASALGVWKRGFAANGR